MRVAGAKNSALPLLMATILSSETCIIDNVPDLEDISVTLKLLRGLGAQVSVGDHSLRIRAERITQNEAPSGLVKAMRASFWVLGPILARTGSARVALPGGDAIGGRPVDLHLRGLVKLGADVRLQHGTVVASVSGGLRPAQIDLEYPSVGATHHLLMTAALVDGETVISGAAREPEVVDLAQFLVSMGAQIDGAGTSVIRILGRRELGPGRAHVIGDRIEAATYLAAAAVTQGSIEVSGIEPQWLAAILDLFSEMGCSVRVSHEKIELTARSRLRPVRFSTNPFPGIATDVQAILAAALCSADGRSEVTETVFENRFGHVPEFRKFGAQIKIDGRTITIDGSDKLTGAVVESGDIRAAAGLVLMGIASEGITNVFEIHHLDRGYEKMVEKLRNLELEIVRVPAFDGREVIHGC